MSEVKVLVSVLNWNAPENTIETIHSVLKSSYVNYTIIIEDNNSIDNSVNKIKEVFPSIRMILLSNNLGFAGAHKKAAEIAINEKYDLLWILNNDVHVFPFTLNEFILAHKRNENALLGSVSVERDGKTIHFGGGAELIDNFNNDENIKYNHFAGKNYYETKIKERPVSDIEGASLIIPVSIIKKFGFMNTRFFLYGEETEYCYRLRRKFNIQSIIVPKALVIHKASQSFAISPNLQCIKEYYFTRNINLVYKKIISGYRISGNGGFPHLFKFFFKHYFLHKLSERDANYKYQYYKKLGYFHSLIRFKGKYLEPNNFLK